VRVAELYLSGYGPDLRRAALVFGDPFQWKSRFNIGRRPRRYASAISIAMEVPARPHD